MILQLIIFTLLLGIIFLLSRKISSFLYIVILQITQSHKKAIYGVATVFLPGTLIHELAHLTIAVLLRVPAGHLTVIPRVENHGEIRAGSVQIAKTDPFRHTVIGLAPLIIGIILIYFTGKFFYYKPFELTTYNLQLTTFIKIYLLFIISTTMFSSKKDLQALIIAGPVVTLMIIALHMLGIRIILDQTLIDTITDILSKLNLYLGIATVVDTIVAIIFYLPLYSRLHRRT